jgi:hypothetical protein
MSDAWGFCHQRDLQSQLSPSVSWVAWRGWNQVWVRSEQGLPVRGDCVHRGSTKRKLCPSWKSTAIINWGFGDVWGGNKPDWGVRVFGNCAFDGKRDPDGRNFTWTVGKLKYNMNASTKHFF